MCGQILAAKSLRDESMKVYAALKHGSLDEARQAVSMIVGRDVARLDARGVMRAAVETVAENTSDGVIAPMLFLAIGGAPLGFFLQGREHDGFDAWLCGAAVQGHRTCARADGRCVQFYPRAAVGAADAGGRGAAAAGCEKRLEDLPPGSLQACEPNSAQTESVCAGLLGLRLAGDAWYHGVLHKKDYIGDAKREVELEDIPRAGRLMYLTAVLALVVFGAGKTLLIVL